MATPAYAQTNLSPEKFAEMQDKKLREQGIGSDSQMTKKTKGKSLGGLGIMAVFLITGGLAWYWFRKKMAE